MREGEKEMEDIVKFDPERDLVLERLIAVPLQWSGAHHLETAAGSWSDLTREYRRR